MGKRDRERVDRIKSGNLFERIRNTGIKLATYGQVKDALLKGVTSNQINKVNELVGDGVLSAEKLKETIMKKSPKQMDEAINNFRREKKAITVDTLTAEIERNKDGFLDLAERVGLNIGYFRNLAEQRMKAKGVN